MYLTGHSGSAEEIAAAKTQVKYAVDYLSLIDGGIAAFRAGKPESIRHTFNIFSDSTICMDGYFPMRAAQLIRNSTTPVEDLNSLTQNMDGDKKQAFLDKLRSETIRWQYTNGKTFDSGIEDNEKVLTAALEAGATAAYQPGDNVIHPRLKVILAKFVK